MWEITREEMEGIPKAVHAKIDFLSDYPVINSAFVLVEGRFDNEIYSHFLDYQNNCEIIFTNGREFIESAFPIPQEYAQKTLGIIDTDFDYALPNKQYPKGLIITETHDLETLLLSSPAFNALVESYCEIPLKNQFESQQGQSIVNIILMAAKPLGLLRLFDHLQKLDGYPGMNFEFLNFRRFIDQHTLGIDIDALIESVKQNTNSAYIRQLNSTGIKNSITNLGSTYSDNWIVCQGHDILSILSIGLENIFGYQHGIRKYPQTKIQNKLKDKTVYRCEYIIGKPFHQKLVTWEMEHSPCRILVDSLR